MDSPENVFTTLTQSQARPRTLASLGRTQSYGKAGRGPNMFYHLNPILPPPPLPHWFINPSNALPAPPLPRRVQPEPQGAHAVDHADATRRRPKKGRPYILPSPRIKDSSRVFQFQQRQTRRYGAESLDNSPTRPPRLGRTYSNPLPLKNNDYPILLRAAASLGDIPLQRVPCGPPGAHQRMSSSICRSSLAY